MEYEQTVAFTGDPAKAIEIAKVAFVQSGYKITELSGASISAEHQGGFVKSASSNPLYGASPIRVSVSGGRLVVGARFEGIEKVKRYIVKLLVGLGLLLGFGLGVPFALLFEERGPMLLGFGLGFGIPAIQLPIHFYVTPVIMRKRATHGLDTLCHNITMVSQ